MRRSFRSSSRAFPATEPSTCYPPKSHRGMALTLLRKPPRHGCTSVVTWLSQSSAFRTYPCRWRTAASGIVCLHCRPGSWMDGRCASPVERANSTRRFPSHRSLHDGALYRVISPIWMSTVLILGKCCLPFLPLTIHVTLRLNGITRLRPVWRLFNLLPTVQGWRLPDSKQWHCHDLERPAGIR